MTTFDLGIYTVRITLRHDNPHWPRYVIFIGNKVVGCQFSVPTLSDCQWLHRNNGVYSTSTYWHATSYGRTLSPRRGRPRKEESDRRRQLEEELAA